jgi:hypothetical protein
MPERCGVLERRCPRTGRAWVDPAAVRCARDDEEVLAARVGLRLAYRDFSAFALILPSRRFWEV